jgi:hypothetical protein
VDSARASDGYVDFEETYVSRGVAESRRQCRTKRREASTNVIR